MEIRRPSVFISYKHSKTTDNDVFHFFEYLDGSRRFQKVWLDVFDMSGDLKEAMRKGISQCDIVIIMLSDAYRESENCRFEMKFAFQTNKKILAVDMTSKPEIAKRDFLKWKELWRSTLTDDTIWTQAVESLFQLLQISFYEHKNVRLRYATLEHHLEETDEILNLDKAITPPIKLFEKNESLSWKLSRVSERLFHRAAPRVFIDYEPAEFLNSESLMRKLTEFKTYIKQFFVGHRIIFEDSPIAQISQRQNFKDRTAHFSYKPARHSSDQTNSISKTVSSIFVALVTNNYNREFMIEANLRRMYILQVQFACSAANWDDPSMLSYGGIPFDRFSAKIPEYNRKSSHKCEQPESDFMGSFTRLGMQIEMLLANPRRPKVNKKFYHPGMQPSNRQFLRGEDDLKLLIEINSNLSSDQMKPLVVFGEPGVGKTELVSIILQDLNVAKMFFDHQITIALWTRYRYEERRDEDLGETSSNGQDVADNEDQLFMHWLIRMLRENDVHLQKELETKSYFYDPGNESQRNAINDIFRQLNITKLFLILDDVPLPMLKQIPTILKSEFDGDLFRLIMISDMADSSNLLSSAFNFKLFKVRECNPAEMVKYFENEESESKGIAKQLTEEQLKTLAEATYGLVDIGNLAISRMKLLNSWNLVRQEFLAIIAELRDHSIIDRDAIHEKRYRQTRHIFDYLFRLGNNDLAERFQVLLIFNINHLISREDAALVWYDDDSDKNFPPKTTTAAFERAKQLSELGIARIKPDDDDEDGWFVMVNKIVRQCFLRYLREMKQEYKACQSLQACDSVLRRGMIKKLVNVQPSFIMEAIKRADSKRKDLAEALFDLYQSEFSQTEIECAEFALKKLSNFKNDDFFLELIRQSKSAVAILKLSDIDIKVKLFHRFFDSSPAADVLEEFFSVNNISDKRADFIMMDKSKNHFDRRFWRLICSFGYMGSLLSFESFFTVYIWPLPLGKACESKYRLEWLRDTESNPDKLIILQSFQQNKCNCDDRTLKKKLKNCTCVRWFIRCGSHKVFSQLISSNRVEKDIQLIHDAVETNQLSILPQVFKLFKVTPENQADTLMLPQLNCFPTVKAAEYGLVGMLKFFKDDWRILSKKDSNGRNVMFDAAKEGHIHIIEYLYSAINHDFFAKLIKTRDNCGRTLLFEAAEHGHDDFIYYVLSKRWGIDGSEVDDDKRTVLFVAAARGQRSVVDVLSSDEAISAMTDKNGRTPLFMAVENCDQFTLDFLIKKQNVDSTLRDKDGDNALKFAILNSNVIATNLLIRNNPEILDAQYRSDGKTALFYAIESGNSALVNTVLALKPNNCLLDNDGYSPVLRALQLGNEEILKSLISYNSGLNVQDSEKGSTPLVQAIELGRFDLALKMVTDFEKHVDIKKSTFDGQSPFKHVCQRALVMAEKGSADSTTARLIEKFLQKGADEAGICESLLMPLLSRSAYIGYDEGSSLICQKLINHMTLEQIEELKAPDGNDIPISLAIKAQDKGVVDALLKKGCDTLSYRDKDGFNLGHVLIHYCSDVDEKRILENFGNLSEIFSHRNENLSGSTLLNCAVRNGDVDLLNKLFLFEAKPIKGVDFLLHDAVDIGKLPVVECLMNWLNEDLINEIRDDSTALALAAKNSAIEIVKFLKKRGVNLYNDMI